MAIARAMQTHSEAASRRWHLHRLLRAIAPSAHAEEIRDVAIVALRDLDRFGHDPSAGAGADDQGTPRLGVCSTITTAQLREASTEFLDTPGATLSHCARGATAACCRYAYAK